MPTAENALLQYESGQTAYPMSALVDSGDRQCFDSSAALFSGANSKEPDVKPDGVATGGVVSPAVSATNDLVDVAALSCYLAGTKVSVAAASDETISRAASDVASISSVTVTSAGAIAVIQGVDSADATFSETRGGAGGPPYIPVGSIEVAQIRLSTDTAAAIDDSEIFQVVGTHQERYDSPLWEIHPQDAQVKMLDVLPQIHTGDTTKSVNASYYDPIFANISLASDFVPSENSHSVSSTPIYGTTLGATSKSLSQGTFTAYLQDGITDPLVQVKDDKLWFKFKPDRYKTPYILDQGLFGMSRSFPAGDSLSASCTISAERSSVEVDT